MKGNHIRHILYHLTHDYNCASVTPYGNQLADTQGSWRGKSSQPRMSNKRSEPLPNTCASMAAVERIPRKHDIMEENSGFQWG